MDWWHKNGGFLSAGVIFLRDTRQELRRGLDHQGGVVLPETKKLLSILSSRKLRSHIADFMRQTYMDRNYPVRERLAIKEGA
jgi:hypothetical protein